MANVVRFRVERRDGPDALKNMLKAWRKNRGWIDKDYRSHQSYETPSKKKRHKRHKNWIKQKKLASVPEPKPEFNVVPDWARA